MKGHSSDPESERNTGDKPPEFEGWVPLSVREARWAEFDNAYK
jgi:hypothetical protein